MKLKSMTILAIQARTRTKSFYRRRLRFKSPQRRFIISVKFTIRPICCPIFLMELPKKKLSIRATAVLKYRLTLATVVLRLNQIRVMEALWLKPIRVMEALRLNPIRAMEVPRLNPIRAMVVLK